MGWYRRAMDPALARIAALLVLAPSALAHADNSPERAETNARSEYVAKVDDACDLSLTMSYDGKSLREHDQYVRHDQSDGARVCNEALRYLWRACRTAAGKAAAKNARIEKIVCKGTPARASNLTLADGTLTLERAANDRGAHDRLRKRFEALLRVSLRLDGSDAAHPDDDEEWKALRYAPNPTRSTTDYCLVNGHKQEFDSQLPHRFRQEDATLSCWKAGQKVTDLQFKAGSKTGFYTQFGRDNDTVFSFLDDRRHGETRDYRAGKLKEITMYERGEIRWTKEFYPNGKVQHYSRGPVGYRQGEDGLIYDLDCAPDIGDDEQLRALCGFEEELTVRIYDGTKKVDRIETWRNGVLQKRSAGDSEYAERSTVNFAAGKKHGIERVLGRDGKLAATITWKDGVKNGLELEYAEGGTKRTKESVWKAGELMQVTEFYLNGNPRQQEVYAGVQRKRFTGFWDTGKVQRQGDFVRCARSWCEQGPHRRFFEDGTPESEVHYQDGKRVGLSRSWWPNRKQATQEKYVDDRRVESRRWDDSGTLIADEQYEADGSRKLAR
jgi:antitoxin component YwqK of YwqJK toxin-antitoxin module